MVRATYRTPDANASIARGALYKAVSSQQNFHLKARHIVTANFNHANLRAMGAQSTSFPAY